MRAGDRRHRNSQERHRSCYRGQCALWLRLSGRLLWAERARGSRLASLPGQSVSRDTSPCRCADDRMIWPVVRISGTFRTSSRWRLKTCWPMPDGTKGKLKARFAAVRVGRRRTPQLIRDKGQQHLPGDEAWLIGEHACRERRNATSPICQRRRICAA
jgi:hypothetical protein